MSKTWGSRFIRSIYTFLNNITDVTSKSLSAAKISNQLMFGFINNEYNVL